MEQRSAIDMMRDVERHFKRLISTYDLPDMPKGDQVVIERTAQLITDSRLAIRDTLFSQTRAEQLEELIAAKGYLTELQAQLLRLGHLVGPADLAEMTARIDMITKYLDE